MDANLREALETIRRCGQDASRAWAVSPAVSYLRARTPANSAARAALEQVAERLLAYRERALAQEPTTWTQVSGSIAQLTGLVEDEVPSVRTLTSAGQLRELANDVLGLPPDWSGTDAADVTATVTVGGKLADGGRPVLEQTVVFASDGVPVAQVPLAALCGWASDGAPSRLPQRAHAS